MTLDIPPADHTKFITVAKSDIKMKPKTVNAVSTAKIQYVCNHFNCAPNVCSYVNSND